VDRKDRLFIAIVAIILVTVTFAGCVQEEQTGGKNHYQELYQEFEPTVDTELIVKGINAAIEVTAWDGDNIKFHSLETSRGDKADLDLVDVIITEEGDTIIIEERHKDSVTDVSVLFQLHVPPYLSVPSVTSKNGAISISGLRSDMEVKTMNGAISLDDVRGSVVASTSNGGIGTRVLSLEGDIRLSSGNGALRVHIALELDAELSVVTGNGQVNVEGLELSTTHTTTKRLEGTLNAGGHLILCETGNGAIDLVGI